MDEETRKEWEKSKRIEAERMKAMRALNEDDKEARINSAFLEPENKKIKGFSRDTSRVLRSIEKAAGFSLGFVILGVVLSNALSLGAMLGVSSAIGILLGIVSAIGLVLICVSAILAIVSLGYSFYYKKTDNFDNKNITITSITTLAILLVYLILFFVSLK